MSRYEDAPCDHLSGTTSVPFAAGEHHTVVVKLRDDGGNELLDLKHVAEGRL